MIDATILESFDSETPNDGPIEVINHAESSDDVDSLIVTALIRRADTYYVVVYAPNSAHEFHDDESRHSVMTTFTDDREEAIADYEHARH